MGVDVATIALFDEVALDAAVRLESADQDAFNVWHADQPLEYPALAPGANAIAFNTGEGDGAYPVWIGRTGDGAIGCFIVDMLMLAEPGGTPWTPPTSAAHSPWPSGTTSPPRPTNAP